MKNIQAPVDFPASEKATSMPLGPGADAQKLLPEQDATHDSANGVDEESLLLQCPRLPPRSLVMLNGDASTAERWRVVVELSVSSSDSLLFHTRLPCFTVRALGMSTKTPTHDDQWIHGAEGTLVSNPPAQDDPQDWTKPCAHPPCLGESPRLLHRGSSTTKARVDAGCFPVCLLLLGGRALGAC